MTHRFPIKEIALQAGLSTATVDRVINDRPNVSAQTRARVAAALQELETQEAQLAAKGRRLFFDVVVEAPDRFAREIRAATDRILPLMGGAVIRPRFEMHEVLEERRTLAILDRIARRGSHGICLKVRDVPLVRQAISDLMARGIPVVTIFTDIPASARIAYAGLDNHSAGRTAAWLMAQTLGRGAQGAILTTLSNRQFAGETARFEGFRAEMAQLLPRLRLVDAWDGGGLNLTTGQAVAGKLAVERDILAVYSMGGGNRAVLAELDRFGIKPQVYIAHDLDQDNLALLRAERLTFVIDHDLEADMRAAFAHLLAYRGLVPPTSTGGGSDIHVVTPMNIPEHRG